MKRLFPNDSKNKNKYVEQSLEPKLFQDIVSEEVILNRLKIEVQTFMG